MEPRKRQATEGVHRIRNRHDRMILHMHRARERRWYQASGPAGLSDNRQHSPKRARTGRTSPSPILMLLVGFGFSVLTARVALNGGIRACFLARRALIALCHRGSGWVVIAFRESIVCGLPVCSSSPSIGSIISSPAGGRPSARCSGISVGIALLGARGRGCHCNRDAIGRCASRVTSH